MEIWRIMVDFGLVILVWMTQLIVYPGFTFYAAEDLRRWHGGYTTRITVIVVPLMFAQVGIVGYQLFVGFNWINLLAALLVVAVWLHTFLWAVPLHNKIGAGDQINFNAHQLVRANWLRTWIWSSIWVLGVMDYLIG